MGPTTTFEEFYRAHHNDAVRWATALVGDRAIGEEIAQEALVAVGRELDHVDRPAAYLRRAVVNRAASWHRAQGREERRLQSHAAGTADSYTPVYRDATADVLVALNRLPYNQRAAVTLRFWADWTDDDIADAVGCAPTTVRVLVHRGLNALRAEIGPKEGRA